ncbi:MAG: hypothetical protein Q8S18_13025 [Bacteroidales bacterium]|nr:hypothetical protein [Bacteroidales bacterium]
MEDAPLDNTGSAPSETISKREKRNTMLLRMLCFFSISYYSLISLTLIAGLIFSDFITGIGRLYVPELDLSRLDIALYLFAGLVLNLGAIFGLILILRRNKAGLTVFLVSALLVMVFQFVPSGTEGWQKYLVEAIIIILMLMLLLHRTTRRKA